jgi:AcrR family transcriptional regulator
MQHLVTLIPSAEERSYEILGSLRHAFAEKGFDGASMQDLARAAGMSVGNFYRYFPSKAAIVEAMCRLDLREIERDFAEIMTSRDPMTALRAKILEHINGECHKDGQLWAEITAASIRKAEIASASARMEEEIVANIATVFAHITGRKPDEAIRRYRGQCQVLVMLVKATTIRSSQHGPADAEFAGQIHRIIDQILTDVSNDIAKG